MKVAMKNSHLDLQIHRERSQQGLIGGINGWFIRNITQQGFGHFAQKSCKPAFHKGLRAVSVY